AGSATDYHAGDRADAARSSGRDRSDSTLVATAVVPGTQWRVFVEHSVLGLRLQTTRYYVLTLLLIGLAVAGALLGAHRFSEVVTRPLEELVSVVRNVSVQRTDPAGTAAAPAAGLPASTPRGALSEVAAL